MANTTDSLYSERLLGSAHALYLAQIHEEALNMLREMNFLTNKFLTKKFICEYSNERIMKTLWMCRNSFLPRDQITSTHITDQDSLQRGKLRSLEKHIELTKQVSGQDGTTIQIFTYFRELTIEVKRCRDEESRRMQKYKSGI